MSSNASVSAASQQPLSPRVIWLICIIAAIGFAFDIYELLMLPLVVGPALQEIAGITPGTDKFKFWFSLLFYVPAVFGGIFGLLGGYLTDRFGRRRILTWSILLYAFSAFAAGFSTSLPMLLFFRTTTFIGVCVEFVAAVAWLAELFDDPKQREKVLGYTQAFSSIGGLMVAIAFALAVQYASKKSLPAIHLPEFLNFFGGTIKDPHAPWRYTLMSGLIPAIPLILIRPFLPESPKWAQRRAAGTLKRPSIKELFSPELRKTTLLTTAMFAASYGVAFGAIQQMPQVVPGIDAVKAQIAKATEGKDEKTAGQLAGRIRQAKAAEYTKSQELGGLFGRFALAALCTVILVRKRLLQLFLIPGLILMPLIFWAFAQGKEQTFFTLDISWIPGFHDLSISLLGLGIFLAGFFTVAQFSFWGNYLPHAFPLHLRGTGESFAANIGGRMIGTCFAGITQYIAGLSMIPGDSVPQKTAYVAAGIATILFAVNFVLSFFLPEGKAEEE
ncbi:MAG: MFS transporter [Pirellulaceae bacterium]|jgi:MFS family permease